jgi:hypothetical protein
MALTNFILTVAGVSAVILLLRSDVKQIRHWLEKNLPLPPSKKPPLCIFFSKSFEEFVFFFFNVNNFQLTMLIYLYVFNMENDKEEEN